MDLAELLALPDVEEICVLRSRVGFLALHGGSQDRGTHEIASQAAAESGASYYAIVQPPNLRVHLTSRRHDPAQSEKFRAFLDHVEIALSVHGFGRDSFTLVADVAGDVIIEPYGPARAAGDRPVRCAGSSSAASTPSCSTLPANTSANGSPITAWGRTDPTRLPPREPGQPAFGARRADRAATGAPWHRRLR